MKGAILSAMLLLSLVSCQEKATIKESIDQPKGALFIIGGGKRPAAMIDRLIAESGLREGGYGIILPMSSIEPDSAVFYAKKQFTKAGIDQVVGFNISADAVRDNQLDSLAKAAMIYISGGDQNKFMAAIGKSAIYESIHQAYQQGTVVAGTSAGAAVMSEVMITGNEIKYPDYQDTFQNIESGNIETNEGLGLVKTAIIDQHFIKRSRYNRLLSAVAEYPQLLGVGIDEATAILVKGDSAEVVGDSQVILMDNQSDQPSELNGKLGMKNLSVKVLFAGEKFSLVK